MPAVAVTFDGVRLDNASATTATNGLWEDYDGTMFSGGTEPDFVYQGTTSLSIKVGTSPQGLGFDHTGTVNFNSPRRVWLAKVIATNYGAMNNKTGTQPGGVFRMSSGGLASASNDYYAVGGDTYPTRGGWLIVPIDPNVTASATTGGGANATAIDGYAFHADFGASSRANNVAMDAIDYIPLGGGLTLKGDTTNGSFQDFIDRDEGQPTTGRYGIVTTLEGIIYVTGKLTIGGATSTPTTDPAGDTLFSDSAQVVVFPEAEFIGQAGFFGLDVDATRAATTVTITDCVFKSAGTEAGNADTRPTFVITGTAGSVTFDGCTFETFNTLTGTTALTLQDCIFLNGEQIDLVGATMDGCSLSGDTGTQPAAYVVTNDLSDISNCSFTYNSGAHAIEIDTAGTYTFTGNVFTSYASGSTGTFSGVTGATNAAIVNTTTTGTVTIQVTGAGATVPSVRNTNAGATTVVEASATITITVQDAATNPIENAQVAVYKVSDNSEVFNSLTNASGIASGSTDQNIDLYIRVRKSTSGTRYIPVETVGDSGSGLSVTVTMTVDANVI